MKSDSDTLFQTGGDMAARMAVKEWGLTPLGLPSSWPQSLRAIVRVMLTSRYAMWMAWGPDLTFFCNDAYLPTLGVKESWALGQSARKVWEEIWPDIGPRIAHVLATGEATWDEALLLFLKRSGYLEETYHTFSYSPLWDDAGQLSGMLCVVTEETNRVIGERRLAALRDFAAELSRSNSEAEVFSAAERCLANTQHDFPFTAVYLCPTDASSCHLMACSGVTAGSSLAPKTIDCGLEHEVWPITRSLNRGESILVEDLETRFGDATSGPWPKAPERAVLLPLVQAGQERPTGVFVAGLNPFLRFDEAYRSFTSLFVGQLAAGLSNARAYDAERKRAEALAEIDRAKTTFFSNVSHEFRAPLTLMLGPLLDTLAGQNGRLPSRVANELIVVHRNGLRLLKLVNTLLDFSRIEAGRVQASFVLTDLATFTAELASVFRSAIEKANLTLSIDAPPLDVPTYVDRDMWEKVVLNLVSNAFKFTLSGAITVRLSKGDRQVRLAVQDTGSGIPNEELPRLFERFHRVEGAKGRTHEGTGIGLALVQELVKIHGGTVRVESEVGRGSTFTVTIPVGKDHLPAERIGGEKELASTAVDYNAFVEEAIRWLPETDTGDAGIRSEVSELDAGTALPRGLGEKTSSPADRDHGDNEESRAQRKRVLIADDNADMRDYLRRLLADRYEVVAVSDGREALRSARQSVPALILSDVMMPNLDGFGLLQAIRADAALASVPVVLLSARAGEEAVLEGIRAGADEYLIKPFSARELVARVDAQIQRKQFERQLAAAEQRLQAALAAAKMAVLEWDPLAGTITTFGTVTDLLGISPSHSLSSISSLFSLVHPDDLDRYRRIVQEATSSGESFQTDFRIVRPQEGRTAWLEERSYPIKDPFSGQTRMVSLIMDVTERKTAEIALKQSEDRARFMVRLDDALRTIIDPDEVSHTAARLLAEHLGCNRTMYAEMSPDQDHCTIVGEYSAGLPSVAGTYRLCDYGAAYVASVRANNPYIEHNAQRDDLSSKERERFAALQIGAWVAAPLFKSGRLVALFFVNSAQPRNWRADEVESVALVASRCWESIERARLTRALLASEERLAFSVEAAELGTFFCPMPLGLIIWNAKCKEHFWLPPDAEIDFDRFYSIIHEEDRERTRLAVGRAVFHHEPYDIEYRTVAPDGRIRWVRAKGRAYFDATGAPTRFDGVTLDVTALKLVEQRRENMLATERAAREEAERVIRMKDEFLATLSHELRTPLNAILGWSQILTRGPLESEDARQGLQAIERNTRAQAQMIEDLLDMSRITAGKVRLDVHCLVLADVVAQAIQSVRPSAEVKGVRLITVIDPNAGPVAGDAGRLQQVVWNLLTNAIKFTPRGGRVQVVLERVNSYLELNVTDTGEGIEPDFLPHVFERFRQADASTTRHYRGLGLGLSIVKHLVELHGGSVRVASPGKGRGSTFILMLPLAPITAPLGDDGLGERQHPRVARGEPLGYVPPNLDGIIVLVVDDDSDARGVIARILRDGRASVITASSAAEALEILRETRPALLISDIGMPGEDGYDLIRKVRALPTESGGRVPAVALTAFARSEDRQRALLAGYQLHVAKPVEPSELLTVCASLVGRISISGEE
jgi:PAS domain S-box-containing protein